VDILDLAAPEWFFLILSFHFINKILVLFKFHIDIILLTPCAHTHLLILEVKFNFSIGIRAWYTLFRFNS
jgi:hypothetical protein